MRDYQITYEVDKGDIVEGHISHLFDFTTKDVKREVEILKAKGYKITGVFLGRDCPECRDCACGGQGVVYNRKVKWFQD